MKACGLDFPDDLHYDIENQVWARPHGDGTTTVGITALGIQLAGEIYMCRPKAVGTPVERGRAIAVVELAKSIVSVTCPVAGEVVETNLRLAEEPELVHRDPYGEGWIARLRLSTGTVVGAGLLHGAAVAPAMERHAWLNRVP
jgi:glycine cleavage system H protein